LLSEASRRFCHGGHGMRLHIYRNFHSCEKFHFLPQSWASDRFTKKFPERKKKKTLFPAFQEIPTQLIRASE
jgi:hypothetical protein